MVLVGRRGKRGPTMTWFSMSSWHSNSLKSATRWWRREEKAERSPKLIQESCVCRVCVCVCVCVCTHNFKGGPKAQASLFPVTLCNIYTNIMFMRVCLYSGGSTIVTWFPERWAVNILHVYHTSCPEKRPYPLS